MRKVLSPNWEYWEIYKEERIFTDPVLSLWFLNLLKKEWVIRTSIHLWRRRCPTQETTLFTHFTAKGKQVLLLYITYFFNIRPWIATHLPSHALFFLRICMSISTITTMSWLGRGHMLYALMSYLVLRSGTTLECDDGGNGMGEAIRWKCNSVHSFGEVCRTK